MTYGLQATASEKKKSGVFWKFSEVTSEKGFRAAGGPLITKLFGMLDDGKKSCIFFNTGEGLLQRDADYFRFDISFMMHPSVGYPVYLHVYYQYVLLNVSFSHYIIL